MILFVAIGGLHDAEDSADQQHKARGHESGAAREEGVLQVGNARSGEQTHAQEGAPDEVQGEGGEQQVQQDLEECLHVRMCLWWVSLGMPDINFPRETLQFLVVTGSCAAAGV